MPTLFHRDTRRAARVGRPDPLKRVKDDHPWGKEQAGIYQNLYLSHLPSFVLMDPEEIRLQIITILKERERITYADLVSLIGGDKDEIRSVCNALRMDELVKDIDNLWLKSTDALYALPDPPNLIIEGPSPDEPTQGSDQSDLGLGFSLGTVLQKVLPDDDQIEERSDPDNSVSVQTVPSVRPKKIFLSYGHDEYTENALRIQKDLMEKKGYEVWFDKDQLKEGRDWELYIEHGLKDCDRFILLMTPHSVRRRNPLDPKSTDGYCLNEISKALEKQKLIIPVMIVELEDGMPTSICRIQFLDIRDSIPIAQQEKRYFIYLDRLVDAIEHQNLDFEGGQRRLIKVLDPLNFQADIGKHLSKFTGREWLLKKISVWLSKDSALRVFWLTGDPGVGKSAIAAYLCHKRGEVVGHHFCTHSNSEERDPRKMLLSLAYQLAQWSHTYDQRIQGINLEEKILENTGALFKILFINLFEGFPKPEHDKIIVIDAIDEATEGTKNDIAEFIRDNWDKTPSWLRLVITSRRESAVTTTLTHLLPEFLDATTPENIEDIRLYLTNQLIARGHDPDARIIAAVLEKSEGIFLYVTEFFKSLDEGILSLDRPEDFPLGMAGIYKGFFKRQFTDLTEEKDKKYYNDQIRPVLECIAAQRGPVPLMLLADETGVTVPDLRDRLTVMGSLFPVRLVGGEPVVAPFHKSIIDWLTGIDEKTQYYLAGQYRIDQKTGGETLAMVSFKAWLAGSSDPYLLKHLAAHLAEEQKWRELSELLRDPRFIREKLESEEMYALLCDYDLMAASDLAPEETKALSLVQGALRLSAHVLTIDPAELATQLWGRLFSLDHPIIQQILNQVASSQIKPWLRPITSSLISPGGPLIRTITEHKDWVMSVAFISEDQKGISASRDGIIHMWDLDTGKCSLTLKGHTSALTTIAVTADYNLSSRNF